MSTTLMPGDILEQRYVIRKVIGRGAYGVVYLAEDQAFNGALWAVKEIWEGALEEQEREEAHTLFRQEVALLSSLNHTGVPKINGHFSRGDRHYLIMEYIEGETLEDRKGRGAIGIDEAVSWAFRLCDILEYLHSLQPAPLVFRDLKPSNIMVTSRGRIILVDFGIARFFKPQKAVDTICMGTPGFCAPEQYGRAQSDVRSDIYSFGATFYHLLSDQDLAQFNFAIPPLSTYNSEVSRDFEELMSRCLQKRMEDRYSSIAKVRQRLRTLKEGNLLKKNPAPAATLSPVSPGAPVIPKIAPGKVPLTPSPQPQAQPPFWSHVLFVPSIVLFVLQFSSIIYGADHRSPENFVRCLLLLGLSLVVSAITSFIAVKVRNYSLSLLNVLLVVVQLSSTLSCLRFIR